MTRPNPVSVAGTTVSVVRPATSVRMIWSPVISNAVSDGEAVAYASGVTTANPRTAVNRTVEAFRTSISSR
ncbi:hypothetical protein GCM10029964_077550 [Kibdelosporangium lantanae]